MKLGQLTWIGLAMLATSLSAGGVIAVAFARAQTGGSVTAIEPTSETSAQPAGGAQSQSPTARPQTTSEAFDARLKALESKIDTLLSRSTPTQLHGETASGGSAATATPIELARPAGAAAMGGAASGSATTPVNIEPISRPASARTDLEWATNSPATVGSVRELEVQLKLALEAFNRTESMFQRGAMSLDEREQTRGKVLLAAAVLEGLDDDLADELDRLRLQMKKKTAELHQAEAQKDVATSVVARNNSLNQRKPGLVNEFDVAKAGAELKIAEAQIEAKRAEIEELALQGARLARRRARIEQAISLSSRATAEVKAVPPPTNTDGVVPPPIGGPRR